MKHSKQRDALLTLLRSTHSHPSADWLYSELRKEFPKISLGTVYRNLSVLAESGEIQKISAGDKSEHFDGFTHEHSHFVCRGCDKILDVELPEAEKLDGIAADKLNLSVDSHSLIFYGLCPECKNQSIKI